MEGQSLEGSQGSGIEKTYILKLPPTKNWRGMMMDGMGYEIEGD